MKIKYIKSKILLSLFLLMIIGGVLSAENENFIISDEPLIITQGYGIQENGSFHHGIDIAIPEGIKIINQQYGVVTKAEYNNIYGLTVMIDYGDIEALYGHNSKLLVNKGDKVTPNQIISLSGSTGNSTGNHLHFEIRKNNKAIDPIIYLK